MYEKRLRICVLHIQQALLYSAACINDHLGLTQEGERALNQIELRWSEYISSKGRTVKLVLVCMV